MADPYYQQQQYQPVAYGGQPMQQAPSNMPQQHYSQAPTPAPVQGYGQRPQSSYAPPAIPAGHPPPPAAYNPQNYGPTGQQPYGAPPGAGYNQGESLENQFAELELLEQRHLQPPPPQGQQQQQMPVPPYIHPGSTPAVAPVSSYTPQSYATQNTPMPPTNVYPPPVPPPSAPYGAPTTYAQPQPQPSVPRGHNNISQYAIYTGTPVVPAGVSFEDEDVDDDIMERRIIIRQAKHAHLPLPAKAYEHFRVFECWQGNIKQPDAYLTLVGYSLELFTADVATRQKPGSESITAIVPNWTVRFHKSRREAHDAAKSLLDKSRYPTSWFSRLPLQVSSTDGHTYSFKTYRPFVGSERDSGAEYLLDSVNKALENEGWKRQYGLANGSRRLAAGSVSHDHAVYKSTSDIDLYRGCILRLNALRTDPVKAADKWLKEDAKATREDESRERHRVERRKRTKEPGGSHRGGGSHRHGTSLFGQRG